MRRFRLGTLMLLIAIAALAVVVVLQQLRIVELEGKVKALSTWW